MKKLTLLSGIGTLAILVVACAPEEADVSSSTEALANEIDDQRHKRGRRGPPPGALEACADAAAGAECSFDGRRGNVEGTCLEPRGVEKVSEELDAVRHLRPPRRALS